MERVRVPQRAGPEHKTLVSISAHTLKDMYGFPYDVGWNYERAYT
jgi:hypothetical protein